MQIDVTPLVEYLDVNIGDKKITLHVDITAEGRKRMAAAFIPAAKNIEMCEALLDKAIKSGNGADKEKNRQRIADIIEGAFTAVVGKTSYDELIDAITRGDISRRADCTTALTQVMSGISDLMARDNNRNAKITEKVEAKKEIRESEELSKTASEDTVEAVEKEYIAAMRDLEGEDVAQPVAFKVVK